MPEHQPKPSIGRQVAFSVCMVLGVLSLLFSAAIVVMALLPSGSPTEGMNGIVMVLLPCALIPAFVFLTAALAIFRAGRSS